jgi:predicted MPP superfamily phosphohydrolase
MKEVMLFFSLVMLLMFLISVAGIRVLLPLFPLNQKRKVLWLMLGVDILSIAGIAGSKTVFRDFPFAATGIKLIVIWLMFQLILIVFSAVIVAGTFFYHKCQRDAKPIDAARRRFIMKAVMLPAAAGLTAYGSFYESGAIIDTYHDIALPELPRELDGFKICQISDVHLGLFFSLEKLEELLQRIILQRPDVLMITGDVFDDTTQNEQAVQMIDSYAKEFSQGVYFCWGNHEYMKGIVKLEALMEKTSIKVLCSSSEVLLNSKPPLYVLGADYPQIRDQGRAEEIKVSMDLALAGVPANAIKILLAHHSLFFDPAFAAGIDLTLAGHTHGGQLGFCGIPLVPLFKYTRGMYRQGSSYGYVNSGAGSWFPFRCGCPPEITYFTLKNQ